MLELLRNLRILASRAAGAVDSPKVPETDEANSALALLSRSELSKIKESGLDPSMQVVKREGVFYKSSHGREHLSIGLQIGDISYFGIISFLPQVQVAHRKELRVQCKRQLMKFEGRAAASLSNR